MSGRVGIYVQPKKGNVGIGTTVPQQQFHVAVASTFTGNVGIGTTKPINTLHVVGNSTFSGGLYPSSCNVYDLGSSNLRWRDIYLKGNTIDLDGTQISRDATTGGISIKSGNSGSNLDIVGNNIFATGNVGIGTTIASSKLHIQGDIRSTGSNISPVFVGGSFIGDGANLLNVRANGQLMELNNSLGLRAPVPNFVVDGNLLVAGNIVNLSASDLTTYTGSAIITPTFTSIGVITGSNIAPRSITYEKLDPSAYNFQWASITGGGLRTDQRVVINNDVIITGNIYDASNVNINALYPSAGIIGSNMAIAVINTSNLTNGAVTIPKLDLSGSGNIGIGTTVATAKVQVSQTTNGAPIMRVNNTLVQSFPPAAMTGYVTDLSSAPYGKGKYVASASTEFSSSSYPAWFAFNKDNTNLSVNGWWSAANYNSSGVYTGSQATIFGGVSYAGEWIQIELPVPIILQSYTIQPYGDSSYLPKNFWLFGSQNNNSWVLLNTQTGISSYQANLTYNVSSVQAYRYYRLVVNQLLGAGTFSVIVELILNGTEESINITADGKMGLGITAPNEMLEVAGNAMFYGNISAGNLGMFRNRIINGDMRIAQRGTSSTISGYGSVDRFQVLYSITTGSITQSQQTLSANDIPYQYGFRYSLRITASTACTNYAYILPFQVIEGNNGTDLNWGTPYGSPITVSFWLKTNLSANSIVSVQHKNWGVDTYSYNTNITILNASTWQYVSFVVTPPPSGSVWNTGNNGMFHTMIGLYDTTSRAPSAGIWYNAQYYGTTSSTNIWATAGNYIEITGLQVEKGTIATPFEFRPYSVELQLCQRYYQQWGPTTGGMRFGTLCTNGTIGYLVMPYFAQMRASPTSIRYSALADFNVLGGSAPTSIVLDSTCSTIGSVAFNFSTTQGSYTAKLVYGTSANAYIGLSAEL